MVLRNGDDGEDSGPEAPARASGNQRSLADPKRLKLWDRIGAVLGSLPVGLGVLATVVGLYSSYREQPRLAAYVSTVAFEDVAIAEDRLFPLPSIKLRLLSQFRSSRGVSSRDSPWRPSSKTSLKELGEFREFLNDRKDQTMRTKESLDRLASGTDKPSNQQSKELLATVFRTHTEAQEAIRGKLRTFTLETSDDAIQIVVKNGLRFSGDQFVTGDGQPWSPGDDEDVDVDDTFQVIARFVKPEAMYMPSVAAGPRPRSPTRVAQIDESTAIASLFAVIDSSRRERLDTVNKSLGETSEDLSAIDTIVTDYKKGLPIGTGSLIVRAVLTNTGGRDMSVYVGGVLQLTSASDPKSANLSVDVVARGNGEKQPGSTCTVPRSGSIELVFTGTQSRAELEIELANNRLSLGKTDLAVLVKLYLSDVEGTQIVSPSAYPTFDRELDQRMKKLRERSVTDATGE